MKKYLLLLTPILLQAGICNAQTFDWFNMQGTLGDEEVAGVAVDASGNVLCAGSFDGTGDFDPGAGTTTLSSAGDRDAFIVKYNSSGNFQWAKQLGNTGRDIGRKVVTDASGNVYVMGLFTGTVDFNPGAGTNNLTSQNGGLRQDVFVVKLDASGNFVWAVQRQAPGVEIYVDDVDLKIDAGNDLYLAYAFGDGFQGNHVKIEKAASSNGATTWIKSLDATGASSYMSYASLALDASGNIYVAGEFSIDVDFDPGAGVHTESTLTTPTAYVVKLTNTGSFSWVRLIGNNVSTLTRAFDVATDAAGNVIVVGRFGGNVDFEPGPGTHFENAGTAIAAYALKLSGTGTFVWVRSWGTNYQNSANGVATDGTGAVYVTGFFADPCTFGLPPNTVTFNSNINTNQEAYTVKFTSAGTLDWVYHIGNGMGDFATGNAIAVSNTGAVHTGGSFDKSALFATNGGLFTATAAGGTDGFIHKVSSGCPPINVVVSLNPATSTLTASAAGGGVTYQWFNCGTNTTVFGATAQSFTPSVTGSYSVILTYNSCSDTSVCTSVTGTGVADMQQAVASIYPNPTTGDISIELNNRYDKVEVEITSAIGTAISKTAYSNTRSINTHVDGAAGIYFISIVADGMVIGRERVVKAD